MNHAMFQDWHDLLATWAVDPNKAGEAFEAVTSHYAEPGRFYHGLLHVKSVLDTVDSLRSSACNLNAVRLAAWLHDVIYDSRASDNEEHSADFAKCVCQELGIPEGGLVASLILKTKTHDARSDPDAQVLIDADLAILGASEVEYRDYAENIRQEYAWVPEVDYRYGRRRVLQSFLDRPKIFHFLSALEEPARQNLATEIARLATG